MIITINHNRGHFAGKTTLAAEPTKAGTLVRPTLHLGEKMMIDTVEFIFSLPQKNALVFDNGFCTNAFVEVASLKEPILSRDLVMVKADDGVFSCGLITAEKYLTRFCVSPGECRLCMELEGREYEGDVPLEAFVFSEALAGGTFFDAYCDLLVREHAITLPDHVDAGWSGWSYFYRTMTEEDCCTQEKALREHFPEADLVQIDDGWQPGDTFSAEWVQNGDTFKTLDQPMGQSRLGLWMSPTLAENRSKIYREHHEMIQKEQDGTEKRVAGGNLIQEEGDGSVFALDLADPTVREHIAQTVKTAQDAYNCHYFKLDFLVRSLIRQSVRNDESVRYGADTNVALYQKTMRQIREAVSKDTFLMACGAPITESVGVFDAIRTSPDITWVMKNNHPGFWYILRRNAQNIFLRSYYHGKVFLCDPDALVLRNHLGRREDHFLPTLEEARSWASVVALSGGTVLINEDLTALEPDRMALAKQVMKPLGIAAKPEDFFEQPYCGHVSLEHHGKRLAGVFNWGEEAKEEAVKNDRPVLAFDAWSKTFLGTFTGDIPLGSLPAHACRVILLVPVPETNGFVASNENLFMGIGEDDLSSGWYFENGQVIKR